MQLESTSAKSEKPSVEDFRGDYAAVAALMQRSWSENKENPFLYTEEFLRSAFQYPGTRPRFSPTVYQNGEPIAFIAGFPRRVLLGKWECNLLLNTFLTSAPEAKGKGYGLALWGEFINRARRAGLDGTIGFCVEGEEMNTAILGCSRAFGYKTARILSIPYLARLIRPAEDAGSRDDDAEVLLEAASAVALRTPLARQWTREEAEWQCRRLGAVCAAHICGARRGVLTGYLMRIADADQTPCVVVDDILWGTLEGEERGQLLQKFWQRAGAAGAKLAIAPHMGYADLDPLRAGGFRRTRRVMHAYLTLWSPTAPTPEVVQSAYIDVF